MSSTPNFSFDNVIINNEAGRQASFINSASYTNNAYDQRYFSYGTYNALDSRVGLESPNFSTNTQFVGASDAVEWPEFDFNYPNQELSPTTQETAQLPAYLDYDETISNIDRFPLDLVQSIPSTILPHLHASTKFPDTSALPIASPFRALHSNMLTLRLQSRQEYSIQEEYNQRSLFSRPLYDVVDDIFSTLNQNALPPGASSQHGYGAVIVNAPQIPLPSAPGSNAAGPAQPSTNSNPPPQIDVDHQDQNQNQVQAEQSQLQRQPRLRQRQRRPKVVAEAAEEPSISQSSNSAPAPSGDIQASSPTSIPSHASSSVLTLDQTVLRIVASWEKKAAKNGQPKEIRYSKKRIESIAKSEAAKKLKEGKYGKTKTTKGPMARVVKKESDN